MPRLPLIALAAGIAIAATAIVVPLWLGSPAAPTPAPAEASAASRAGSAAQAMATGERPAAPAASPAPGIPTAPDRVDRSAPTVPGAGALPVPVEPPDAPDVTVVEILDQARLPADARRPERTVSVERWLGQPEPVRVEHHQDPAATATYAAADRLIVRRTAGAAEGALRAAALEAGARGIEPIGSGRFYRVLVDPLDLAGYDRVLDRLSMALAVGYVEPDHIWFTQLTPDDPSFDLLWGMHNAGQSNGTPDADIDAVEAWDLTTGDGSVVVGVIDTGIDYRHPDLAANIWTNPGESGDGKETNGVDDDGNGYIDDVHGWDFAYGDNDPMDVDGHGTHCSGTIGGIGDNATGVTGVCWKVQLMALKFLSDSGSGTTSNAITAIEYAVTNGCDLTSNSWGGGSPSVALRDAIQAAQDAGQLFIAAAGNAYRDSDSNPSYPAAYDLEAIISVAATDHRDLKADFSNWGLTTVDLAAPGVAIHSCLPGGSYTSYSGTSMACPHVSGSAALIWSMSPMSTAAEVKALLLDHADPIAAMAGRVVSGGRLNAYAALLPLSGPWVRAVELAYLEDGTGGSDGDGDGWIEVGERVAITYSARNVGSEAATGVAVAATTSDPVATIVDAGGPIGDLAAGSSTAGATILVDVASAVATPHLVVIDLTFTSASGDSWVEPLSFTVNQIATVSGRVATLTGDTPIEGATVSYSGRLNGSLSTAADGTWSADLVSGSYTFSAVASGYHAAGPREVTIPPAAAEVDFALGRPLITVTPDAVTDSLVWGQTATHTVTIGNEGDLPLRVRLETDLGDLDTTGSGGDSAGYAWLDSKDPNGPPHAWEDIASAGNRLTTVSNGDEVAEQITLPFRFPFLNSTRSSFYVTDNGYISSYGASRPVNAAMSSMSGHTIAPFWDDLDPSVAGDVYYSGNAVRAIVQWDGVAGPDQDRHTFQLVLYPSGDIEFRYQSLVGATDSCTVGVNPSFSSSIEIARDEAYLENGLTIACYRPRPWLGVDATTAVIEAGKTLDVDLTLDSRGGKAGIFTGALSIAHDDPSADPVRVPVTMTVSGESRLEVATTDMVWGDQIRGSTVTRSFAVSNHGPGAAVLSAGSFPAGFAMDPAGPVSIPGFSSVQIGLAFSPTVFGSHTGDAVFTTDDDDVPTFSIAVSGNAIVGPVRGFELSEVPESQTAGAPFAVSATAVDAFGNTVDSYHDSARIQAFATGSSGLILLTEIDLQSGTPAAIELHNIGPVPADTTGWRLVVGDDPSEINAVLAASWELPDSIAPRATLVVDDDPEGGRYFGAEIAWRAGMPGWAMILDAEDEIEDLVFFNWDEPSIQTFAPVVGDTTVELDDHWVGPGKMLFGSYGRSLRRYGRDSDQDDDWWSSYSSDLGTTHPSIGHGSPGIALPVAPIETGAFSAGRWSGEITIPNSAGSAYLLMGEGWVSGHSNRFVVAGEASLLADPSTLAFGEVIAGDSSESTVTLLNPTAAEVTVSGITASDPVFTAGPAGPVTVPAYGRVELTVTFAPTTPGTKHSATLTVASDDTPSDLEIAVVGAAITGPLHSLTWAAVEDQVVGLPFAASLSAEDAYGNTVEVADAELSASTTIPSRVLVTEVAFDYSAWIELHNTSDQAVDTSGWRLIASDSYADATATNPVAWSLPPRLAAGAVLVIRDYAYAEHYWGSNLSWDWGGNSWLALIDDRGEVIDLVVQGWPSVEGVEASYTGGTIRLDDGWRGSGLPGRSSSWTSHRRTGNVDTNHRDGWIRASSDFGDPNSGMVRPLTQIIDLALEPGSTGAITAGTWSGSLTIPTITAAAILRAEAAGISGESAAFAVTGSDLLAVSPATVAFGEVIVNDSGRAPIELRNLSDQELTIDSLVVSDPRLSIAFENGASIPPYAAVRPDLVFSPTATGAITAELTVTCSASEPRTHVVDASGTGVIGPQVGFAWGSIATQAENVAFPVTLRAVDAFGNTVVDYTGSAALTGTRGGPPLLLSEITIDADASGVEVANVSSGSVDLAGWKVVVSDSLTDINQVNPVAWELSGSLAAGGVDYRTEAAGDRYWGGPINWPSSYNNPLWAALLAPDGSLADILVYRWGSDDMKAFAPVVGDRTLSLEGSWAGSSAWGYADHFIRHGDADDDDRYDWTYSNTGHLGGTGDLVLPFCDPLTIAPASIGPFVAGTWTGPLTIDGQTPALRLHALGGGFHGESELFVVAGSPNPPVIDQGETIRVTMSEDGSPTAFALTLSATDPDGDPQSWALASTPDRGWASVSRATGSVAYRPPADWHGSTAFDIRVDDGTLWSDSITVIVIVEPVNDAPVAVDDLAETVRGAPVDIAVLTNDGDIDGDSLSVSIHQEPGFGSVSVDGEIIRYQPASDFIGWDGIRYRVSDGQGGEAFAWASIRVNAGSGADLIRVDPAATGASTGLTWGDAVPSLKYAIDVAGSGDEIWVVGGTHTPGPAGDRDQHFQLAAGVGIRGGFVGDENDPAERDPANPATVLSGDLAGDDDGDDNRTENSYRVLVRGPGSAATLLDRVVVSGGEGAGRGAGFTAWSAVELIARDTTFRANRAASDGGAISLPDGSSLRLSGCSFIDNATTSTWRSSEGGAIHLRYGTLTMEDCELTGNTAPDGSALYLSSSAAYIDGCRFVANTGGTAPLVAESSTLILARCVLADHDTATYGALYVSDCSATLSDCLITGNRSSRDTVYSRYSQIQLEGCTIADNILAAANPIVAGVQFASGTMGVLRNCVLWGNTRAGVADRSAQITGTAIVIDSCIQNYDGAYGDNGIIDHDPAFLDPSDPDGADDRWATRDDGYMLTDGSPCIDQGGTSGASFYDLSGHPRGYLTDPDLGAYDRGDEAGLPIADAGADQETDAGVAVTLDGGGSRDPNDHPQPLSFRWRQVDGPTLLTLDDPSGETCQALALTPGSYTLELVVSDGSSSSADLMILSVVGGRSIAIRLRDATGAPLPGEVNLVEPPDGSVGTSGEWTWFRRLPAGDRWIRFGVVPDGDG